MWLRKTDASGSSAMMGDHRTPQDPAQQKPAPDRSSASMLLSAAQIWSTEASEVPAPQVSEPAAAGVPPPLPDVSQPEVKLPAQVEPQVRLAPVVAQMIVATGAIPATAALKTV